MRNEVSSGSDASSRVLVVECGCGTVRYRVADAFLYASNCHCSRCRAATGSAFKPFAGIEREKLEITDGLDALLVFGEEDLNDTRCRACGSLLFSVVRDGAYVHVAMGSLVDAPSIRPTKHIFVGSKAPWFEITIVYVLMAIAVGVTTVTIASSRRAGTSLPLWPCFALAAFVLIEARVFVDTPSLTNALQAVPNEQTTRYISDRASGLFIGGGVTMLGLACAGVFFAGLARRARAAAKDSIAPALIVIGGAATIAVVGTGAALALILADAASSDRAPTTVAAVYTIVDSLGYTGFTAMGFVTAGVAVASFREHSFSRAVGWMSAIGTGLFVVCTFLPFLSWAPALLWLFFVGIALVREEARRAPRLAAIGSAAA